MFPLPDNRDSDAPPRNRGSRARRHDVAVRKFDAAAADAASIVPPLCRQDMAHFMAPHFMAHFMAPTDNSSELLSGREHGPGLWRRAVSSCAPLRGRVAAVARARHSRSGRPRAAGSPSPHRPRAPQDPRRRACAAPRAPEVGGRAQIATSGRATPPQLPGPGLFRSLQISSWYHRPPRRRKDCGRPRHEPAARRSHLLAVAAVSAIGAATGAPEEPSCFLPYPTA
jgi:hypothetical protein